MSLIQNTKSELYNILASISGSNNVTEEPADLISYSMDSSPEPARIPKIVVRPGSTDEISQILRIANRHRYPVVPRGAGTCAGGGATALQPNSIILDLTRLNKVLEISDVDLTVTAQAGITWGALLREAAKKGYRPPFFSTESGFSGTIGGAISSASMASQGATVGGSAADNVVTLEVVLPTGDIIRTGSDALPKGGKFAKICNGGDLAGIFLGSMGVYGIITEATFKLEPLPEYSAFGAYVFDRWEDGINFALKMIKNKIPETLNAIPGNRAVKKSYNMDKPVAFKFVVEGNDEVIVNRRKGLADRYAQEEKGVEVEDAVKKTKEWWDDWGNRLTKIAAKYEMMWGMICHRIPLKKLPQAQATADEYFYNEMKIDDYNIKLEVGAYFTEMRPALGYYPYIFFDDSDPVIRKKAWEVWDGWFEKCIITYGACPYWLGYGWARHTIPKLRTPVYNMMVTLKKALDPNNILNPGLFTF